jgi:uncharacterized integral membrane protein
MVYERRRFFGFSSAWQLTIENVKWQVIIVMIIVIILAFIITLICEYFNEVFCCCRHPSPQHDDHQIKQ